MSRFDKLKEGFGILSQPKETKEVYEETTKPIMNTTKEETVEEEVSRYFHENSKDLLNITETKGRTADGRNIRINNSKRIRIYEPTKFNDVKLIGEEIKKGKIVVVNYKNLDDEESMKVENFLYGMCYYADIEPEAVHDGIISIDPQHTINEK